MEVSLYHRMIVTSTNSNSIYIWDYEFCKLISCLELESGLEPTAFAFINGYSILIIAANDAKLYVVHFKQMDAQKYSFETITVIHLTELNIDLKIGKTENLIDGIELSYGRTKKGSTFKKLS